MTVIAEKAGSAAASTDVDGMYQVLADLERPCYVVRTGSGIGLTGHRPADDDAVVAAVGPLPPERLGSSEFRARHGVRLAYMGGAMAGGIASVDQVVALARAGCLGSFGAAGLLPERVEDAVGRIAGAIPELPFAVNLIHSPSEERLERSAVELFLRRGVRCVEASAFMNLTRHVVRYRLAGLRQSMDGAVVARNRLVAKVSRSEVADVFLRPAPPGLVADLLAAGDIDAEQAALAPRVPMADDITVEADSGGHTDRRPLPALFPAILRHRDTVHQELGLPHQVRLGAGGGIGTPAAVAAAFAMGADYVVTGSVNQACLEAGTSPEVKELLAGAGIADCEMAPAADMFELGVELQVLRKGTLFAMRAKRLHQLYRTYDGIEALPPAELQRLEQQILGRPVDQIWSEVVGYFTRRDPAQLERAAQDPKRRMALIFRWYLGMASRWASTGERSRVADYQIWCGPAMGSFNEWANGSYLAAPTNRRVGDVAVQLMRGAAFESRVHQLRLNGVRLPAGCTTYRPQPPASDRQVTT